MGLADVTRDSVIRAVAEYDAVGQDEFLAKYGFGRARRYVLVVDGRRYDSKAIVGAAHGYATGRALGAHDFSGGAATVQRTLETLGFRVLVDRDSPDDPGTTGDRTGRT